MPYALKAREASERQAWVSELSEEQAQVQRDSEDRKRIR